MVRVQVIPLAQEMRTTACALDKGVPKPEHSDLTERGDGERMENLARKFGLAPRSASDMPHGPFITTAQGSEARKRREAGQIVLEVATFDSVELP